MTTIFVIYYTAEVYVKRSWERLVDAYYDIIDSDLVARIKDRFRPERDMPVAHFGADERYADELAVSRERIMTTGELWLDDTAMQLHEDLANVQKSTVDTFKAAIDAALAKFEHEPMDPDLNPMQPQARAEIIPWGQELMDEIRTLGADLTEVCRAA